MVPKEHLVSITCTQNQCFKVGGSPTLGSNPTKALIGLDELKQKLIYMRKSDERKVVILYFDDNFKFMNLIKVLEHICSGKIRVMFGKVHRLVEF